MRFASKHFDPVLGIDLHFTIPPGPPFPMPNPFIGMLLDVFDYLPVIGSTVLVNGVHRAQAGTGGIALIPHIPIGGVFLVPPENECEMFMGSSTVSVDSDAFGYLALPALSCNSIGMFRPLRLGKNKPKKPKKPFSMVLPTSVVISIPWGNPVVVGGTPTISLMALAMRAGFWMLGKGFKKLRKLQKKSPRMKRISDKTHRAAGRLMDKLRISPEARARDRVHRSICTVTGHPVDVATGRVFTAAVDFELGGPLPLRWERVWSSTSTYRGPLGHGVHFCYDLGLFADAEAVAVRLADGRGAVFPPLAEGEVYVHRAERLTLRREEGEYVLTDALGQSARLGEVGRPSGELAVKSIEAASGGRLRFDYDPRGGLASITSSAGVSCAVESDAEGRITGISVPDREEPGKRVRLAAYEYDEAGNLARARDALGSPIAYVYDQHLLAQETNRSGVSFWFEYDARGPEGRCVRTRGDGGLLTRYLTYEPDRGRTAVKDGEGHATVHLYNAAGLVTRSIDPLGGEDVFEWDDDNRLVREADRAGRVTEYEYTEEGQLARIRHPAGRAVRAVYDPSGHLVSLADEAGEVWDRDAEERDRAVYRSARHGCRWRYEIDDRGIPVLRQGEEPEPVPAHPLGWRFGGLLESDDIGVPDADEPLFLNGELVAGLSADRPEEQVELDVLGRPVRTVDVFGDATSYEYDPGGLLLAYRDRDGNVWSFADSAASRTRRETDPTGRTSAYGFSTEGRLTEIVDSGGAVHRYDYDPRGFHVGTSRDGEPFARMSVGADGSLLEMQDGRGRPLCSYTLDASGLRASERRASGATWRYSYDGLGRFTRIEGDTIKLAFAYDRSGRRTREERDGEGVERVFKDGQLEEVRVFGRFRIRYGYDGDGGVTITGPSGASERLFFTPLGLARREAPSGVVEVSHFDAAGRCLSQRRGTARAINADAPAALRRYRYTKEGRLAAILDRDEGITAFEHDGAGRLVRAVYPDGAAQAYVYDAAGNLLEQPGVELALGKSNQLASVNGERVTYDERGRLSRRDGPSTHAAYTYDDADMLVQVDVGGDQWTAEYDPLGRRVRTTWRGRATSYFWDRSRLAAEIDPEGKLRVYVYADADALVPLMFIDYASKGADPGSGRAYFVYTDHRGAVVRVDDAEGRRVWQASLSPFGRAAVAEGAAISMRLRFPGHYEDEETGLFYNRWRYYSPELGRYLQPDPLDTKGGVNLYAYARDPLTQVDLFGLCPDDSPSNSQSKKRTRDESDLEDDANNDGSSGDDGDGDGDDRAAKRAKGLQGGPAARKSKIPGLGRLSKAFSSSSGGGQSSKKRGKGRADPPPSDRPKRSNAGRGWERFKERLSSMADSFKDLDLKEGPDTKMGDPEADDLGADDASDKSFNPKSEAGPKFTAEARAVRPASTSFKADVELDHKVGDDIKELTVSKADGSGKETYKDVKVETVNGHQVLKIGDHAYTRENFPGKTGYFMKGKPGDLYDNEEGFKQWLNTKNAGRNNTVSFDDASSQAKIAPNARPTGKEFKGDSGDQDLYKNKGERVDLDEGGSKTRGAPWQDVETPDRRTGAGSRNWPKGTPDVNEERKGRPNPHFSERSHLRANRAGGAMHGYNGVPASFHQNTESTAIEEAFSEHAKKHDLVTKHEAYPDGPNAKYIRVKAYVRKNNSKTGPFVKVFDHVMDADRGPIEKPAVDLLKSQVDDALKGGTDLGGKGLPDANVPNLDRASYDDKKEGNTIKSTEIVDKQMTDHSKANWVIRVSGCGK